jgi:membrane-associated phospholipid phosphatase
MRPSAFINDGVFGFNFFTPIADLDSFPSGHAAVAAGLASGLSILWPHNRAIFMNVAAAVASTRVITGDHFLSDAMSGFAVGLCACWFLQLLFRHFGIHVGPSLNGSGGTPATIDHRSES